MENDEYNVENARKIIETREWTRRELDALGFEVTPSKATVLFVRHPEISGEKLYRKLRERGILIRHFSVERIKDYNRITVGTQEQMEAVVEAVGKILGDR